MKRLLLVATAALIASSALAQTYRDSGGTLVPGFVPIEPGQGPLFTPSNPGVVSGSFSASLSGFQPTPAYAQLTVGTSSARVALPSGTVVVVYNTGSNDAYVALGNSSVAATIAGDVVKAGGWMAFTVPTSATNIAAITSTGTTALNVSGGAGLPTGSAGTGTGGGGGTVAQGTPASNASGAWWDQLAQSGSAVGASNGLYVQPGTGAAFPSTQSGSWTINLGTLNGAATAANQTSVIGPVSAGPAAANSLAMGGVYNSSLPSLTNGQQAAEQLDSSARQLVNIGAGVHIGATGSAVPASAQYAGAVSSGNLTGIIQADHSAQINFSSTAAQQIVALVSGKAIYVTAWDVMANGTSTFQLEYGTQTTNPCDTGTTALTGPYPLTAQAGLSKAGGLGAVLIVPAGKQLCAVASAAVQMSGSVSYTQF
jgi:hypothetical protein